MKRKLYVLTAVTGVAFTAGVALFGAGNGNKGIKGEANTVSTSHKIEITADDVASMTGETFSKGEITWNATGVSSSGGKISFNGGSFYNETLAGLPSDVPGALVGTGFTKIEFKGLESDNDIKVILMSDDQTENETEYIDKAESSSDKSLVLSSAKKVARVKLEFSYENALEEQVTVQASFTSLAFHYSCGTSS